MEHKSATPQLIDMILKWVSEANLVTRTRKLFTYLWNRGLRLPTQVRRSLLRTDTEKNS